MALDAWVVEAHASPIHTADLLERLRTAVDGRQDADERAARVAASLRARSLSADVLTTSQRRGDPDRLASQILHAEDRFSVVALVLQPGQQTVIHDHLTWCVAAVLLGEERETTYRDHGDHLTPVAHSTNPTGSVTALAPPGDIHRVRNPTRTTAISLHVYGTDLRASGSSVRRTYDLPVRQAWPHEQLRPSTPAPARRTR